MSCASKLRRIIGFLGPVLVVISILQAGLVLVLSGSASAQPRVNPCDTPEDVPRGVAVCDGLGDGDDDGDGDGEGGGGEPPPVPGTGASAPPDCVATQVPDEAIVVAYTLAWSEIPEPPSGLPEALGGDDTSQLWIDPCGDDGGYFWVDPDGGPASSTASPEDLAWIAYARIVQDFPEPILSTDPGDGVPSIVNTPTFVAVENWVDGFTETESDGPVTVTLTAEPSLSIDPGEPGSGTVACEGSGSRYVPGEGSPEVQAATPGACAHPYSMRTGVTGRPEAWRGDVTVTWELDWTSTTGGSGTFPDEVRSAELSREVVEVQAIVTEVE